MKVGTKTVKSSMSLLAYKSTNCNPLKHAVQGKCGHFTILLFQNLNHYNKSVVSPLYHKIGIFCIYIFALLLWLADVHCDDHHVSGCLVSILHGVSLGIVWWPQDYPCSHGHHRSTLCKVLHLLQPLHLCHCKQKVCVFFH